MINARSPKGNPEVGLVNSLQDVERVFLNQLCLINLLESIFSVMLISFMAILKSANLHWNSRRPTNLFALVITVSLHE